MFLLKNNVTKGKPQGAANVAKAHTHLTIDNHADWLPTGRRLVAGRRQSAGDQSAVKYQICLI